MAYGFIPRDSIVTVAKLRQEKKDLAAWLKDLESKLGALESEIIDRLKAGQAPEPGAVAFVEQVKAPVRPEYKGWIEEHFGPAEVQRVINETQARMIAEGREFREVLRVEAV